jgi:Zn-dependent protease with chaperone function
VIKARVVLGLHAALATLAAGVLAFVVVVVAGVVTFRAPSAQALATACSRLALPDVDLVSVTALGLGSLAVAVVMLSAQALARQAVATRRFVRSLRVIGAGPAGSHLFVADAPQAFCAGLLRPRTYISDATLEALGAEELEAVLAHETHHRRLRDPLRIAVARAIGEGLFFLPAARRLAERYGALAELAADRAAVRVLGARPLASALLAFEGASPAVVGITPERLEHLLDDRSDWGLPAALLAWSLAVLGAIAAVALRLDAAQGAMVNLPLVAAQSCMLVMAAVPVIAGAIAAMSARRIAPRFRRRHG